LQSRHSYTHPAQRATTKATRVTHTHPPPPLQWPTSAAAAAAARYLSSVSACFRAVSSWRPFSRVPTVPFTWETPPVASGRPTPRRRDEVVRGSPLGASRPLSLRAKTIKKKKRPRCLQIYDRPQKNPPLPGPAPPLTDRPDKVPARPAVLLRHPSLVLKQTNSVAKSPKWPT